MIFFLFQYLKKELKESPFTVDDSLKTTIMTWLHKQPSEFYKNNIKKLISSWQCCSAIFPENDVEVSSVCDGSDGQVCRQYHSKLRLFWLYLNAFLQLMLSIDDNNSFKKPSLTFLPFSDPSLIFYRSYIHRLYS